MNDKADNPDILKQVYLLVFGRRIQHGIFIKTVTQPLSCYLASNQESFYAHDAVKKLKTIQNVIPNFFVI